MKGTIIILGSLLALAGCGGAAQTQTHAVGQTPTTQTTQTAGMTKAQAGKAYLAAIAPANKALDTWKVKVQRYSGNETQDQLAADAQPLVDVIGQTETKLSQLASDYPPAATDIKAQLAAVGALRGDLASVENTSAWEQQLLRDSGTANSDAKIVRTDLGLSNTK